MNHIISIGHDVTEIDRIRYLTEKFHQKFLEKIFTTAELKYCLSKSNPYPSLAARFAAKEAISKAFHCGIGRQFKFHTAEVLNDLNGQPTVFLNTQGQKLLAQLKGSNILISLTHTRSLASAVVIIAS